MIDCRSRRDTRMELRQWRRSHAMTGARKSRGDSAAFSLSCARVLSSGVAILVLGFTNFAGAAKFSPLYAFSGGSDGAARVSRLLFDDAGNLYGTASRGGANGVGTVFELGANGTLAVL